MGQAFSLSPGLAIDFLDLGDTAEAQQRPRPRLLKIHSETKVVGDFHLEVEIELVIQITFKVLPAKEAGKAPPQDAQACHNDSPDGLRKRPRMAEIRSQFCVSAASCFLPARVMR